MKYSSLLCILFFSCNACIAAASNTNIVPVITFLLDESQCELFINSDSTFVVPDTVTEIEFTLQGGEGGNGGRSDSIFVIDGDIITNDTSVLPGFGALGQQIKSLVQVTPGQTFNLTVGQGGQGGMHGPSGGLGGTGGIGNPLGESGQDGTGLGGSGGGGGAGGTTSVIDGEFQLIAQGGSGGGGAARNVGGNGQNGSDGGAGGGGIEEDGSDAGGNGGQGDTGNGQNSTNQVFDVSNFTRSLSGQAGSITINFCDN